MNELEIKFPGKNIDINGNEENPRLELLHMWDGTVITYEQAFPCLRDALRLLARLRTNSAAEALDRLKASELDSLSFTFQVHKYSDPQTSSISDMGLPAQSFQDIFNPNQVLCPGSPIPEAEGLGRDYVLFSHASSPNPPATPNLDLLTTDIVDLDDMLFQYDVFPEDDAGASNQNTSATEDNASTPPASTLDESTAASSQDDGFSPSRGVRCQYSSFGEETKKNPPVVVVVRTRCWPPNAPAHARPHRMVDINEE